MKERECDFVLYLKSKRQWIEVYLWGVHPTTFARWDAGRWGYFLATWEKPRIGKFGELHFVENRLRHDTVVHELFHVLVETMWSNGETITRRNEEKYAKILDELDRKFLRELKKIRPKIRL